MKCPNCGAGNLDGKKFCGDCGTPIPEPPPPAEPMQPIPAISQQKGWLSSNWKAIVALAVVLVVVIAFVGLVYTQPWSKIKVLVATDREVNAKIYIDGELVGQVSVSAGGWDAVGVWSVTVGRHTVEVDAGYWYYTPSYWVPETWDWWSLSYVGGYYTTAYWTYVDLDGTPDYTFAYEVGPLYTKNAYIQL